MYHLCEMAGVQFDAHYSVTSVDPPELVKFIRENYPDVAFERTFYCDSEPRHIWRDGKHRAITMWSLLEDNAMPPTRKWRYCCEDLKECHGRDRITVTGVRWAESARRRGLHGVVDFVGEPKKTLKAAEIFGATYELNNKGAVILNDDNDENRRMVERCYRTRKTMVNPIVDWEDEDVWAFLNGDYIREGGVPHCCLYDQGYTRLGCIGCPMTGTRGMTRDLLRYPKYRDHYLRAFQRMVDNHKGEIKALKPENREKLDIEISGPLRKMVDKVMEGAELVSGVTADAVRLFRSWISWGAN